ncbi:universal stress protein PHOS32-like [Chenopodium quinoa]|uniref:UspA domain-containing protein n=1 Tax=Chenopodium quinoa TaxID=63459 RepID=A0A803LP72_CHEQI|nr:universal stress protein PHOS32-like [Chenopodium quinoa]
MMTIEEDQEEYNWREVQLPSQLPKPELERETGERRRGRDVVIAVDHGPNNVKNEDVYQASQILMDKLAVEAFQVEMVKSVARIVEGDAGKVICKEAERLRPAAVIMGSRGRGLVQSVLQGSVGEYCIHHCKTAPIIIVPGKEAGELSVV